jgi:hypothetical protein
LSKIYDIEANKLDSNYEIEEENINYDYYNKIFYWVTKRDLDKKKLISKNKNYDIFILKDKLIELLEFSKTIIPELKYEFWNYINLSHSYWTLKIPDKNKYDIRRVIILFFHEMTHFFRYINWEKNLWFDYSFSDYNNLEEWIATYNEYLYWNKIIDYWKHIPYNNFCYNVLLKEINLEEKKQKIYDILKNKWFSKKKSLTYFYRFYRYTKIWGNDLFLKDLIYSKWYDIVKKLIIENKENYEKIISGKIWLFEFKNSFINSRKNIESKNYFNIMLRKIKDII